MKSIDKFWIACDKVGTACGHFIMSYWNRVSDSATETQQKVKPLVNTTYQAGIAIYTFYTTALISISILPLVISTMTLFATIPFFSDLTAPYIYGVGLIVASAAGYFKYQDVKRREYLDEQTEDNKVQIERLTKELSLAKAKLTRVTEVIPAKKSDDKSKPESPTAVQFSHTTNNRRQRLRVSPKQPRLRRSISPLPIPI